MQFFGNSSNKEQSEPRDVYITGLSKLPQPELSTYRSLFQTKARAILGITNEDDIDIRITTKQPTAAALASDKSDKPKQGKQSDEKSIEERALNYHSIEPEHTFEQLVLPDETLKDITNAADLASVQDLVFKEWGLNQIEPHPRTALNFYGPSGTGKTLAAHALAHRLKMKILSASYADIESKFVGDGPKNVQAIFEAAKRDHALLFIDEADSLLSKRLTNVTSGSESAINSMRSQLLICLEQFEGIVIFATNLIENYDHAFETRMRYVEFKLPDKDCLRRIWLSHLVDGLPLDDKKDVIAEKLSEIDGICGRDIRNAVIDAAVVTALKRTQSHDNPQNDPHARVTLAALTDAIEAIKTRNSKQAELAAGQKGRPITDEEKKETSEKIKNALSAQKKEEKPTE